MTRTKGGQDRTPTGHRPDRQKPTKPDVAPRPHAKAEAVTLLAAGHTVTEVASRLGVRRQTVSGWKNHSATEAVTAEKAKRAASLDDALTSARKLLRDNTENAARLLVTQLGSGEEAIAQSAAKTLLDRAGLPRVEVVQTGATPLDLSGLTEEELGVFETLLAKVGGA